MPSTPDPASSTPNGAWRDSLDRYLVSHGIDAGSAHVEGNSATPTIRTTDLALQFELRELIPRTSFSWNGPTSRTAGATKRPSSAPGSGEFRLAVRPTARTAKGWARGSLTWSNLPFLLNRKNFDEQQHRWFCQFVALHRAAGPTLPGGDLDWVYLDDFVNPVLWHLLRQAADLGIQFVGPTAAAEVIHADSAKLVLDAALDEHHVRLRPDLVIDGVSADIQQARAISTHGVYSYTLGKPQRYTLAPFEHELTSEHLAILSGTSSIPAQLDVPEAEASTFFGSYLPALRERIAVESRNHSVTLPPPAPQVLVLTATHTPRQSVTVSWRWLRQGSAEKIAPQSLVPDALLPTGVTLNDDLRPSKLTGIEAAEFMARILPEIKRLPGVRVEVVGKAPNYRELTGTPKLTVTTVPTERHDWFDLGVIVTVDGKDIPFVPLFRALASGRRKLLLVDGSYLSLTHPAFGPLTELINEAKDLAEWEANPVISKHQTSLWADFEDLADESIPAIEWKRLVDSVNGDSPKPVEAPAGLTAELRPYQADGFSWLAFLWRNRLGAILADDMGLGKTVQCLALIQHAANEAASDGPQRPRPFLVVAPTSVVGNWVAEAKRFTKGLVVHEVTATEAKSKESIADAAAGAHIVVTSYALLRLNFDAYQGVAQTMGWAGLILDEAQFVKNSASKVHECARELDVPFKLAVTGTPLENSLTELHALCAIVAPGLFPSARRFGEEYVRPIEQTTPGISQGTGAGSSPAAVAGLRSERLARLRRRIRPFMLRRTKDLVASELPAKQEQTIQVELSQEHRALYDLYLQRERQKLFGLLEDLDRNRFIVFRSLTLLRLLALDASLLGDEYSDIPSSKLDILCEQLEDVVAEGHRALVFSQFTSYLKKAADRLEAAGIPYSYLDGSTLKRGTAIEDFTTGEATVFLISLKAGGFGLNLTRADYVFLLDPWWNPATESQAVDRAHRIGQTKNVMVYRLIATDTIEEKVMKLKERKAALFDAVVDDGALFSSAMTADDVRQLLA
ncbi:DEAD/DEAH box helicase [Lysinibacter cavernae]|uniref:Superfamily II DNA or RNA helicase n=1 Tax=Lysinibacter cavernae TaxID=1640652 RepID=A0A7X5R4D2_9MICO|nr:DEAD/DEAH box helicase [Lysinibacter cavernae]NIH55346.1 superfamily II DNA or RNA helicase [Lysinibacter cavernae]